MRRILVTGIPRSGSTMLAGMLTDLPRQVVYNEPKPARIPGLQRARRWGVKQVSVPKIRRTLEVFKPQGVVIMARDPRDAVLSYADRIRRAKRAQDPGVFQSMLVKRTRKIWGAALYSMELAKQPWPVMVVPYNQFVASPEMRCSLGEWLGWELVEENTSHWIMKDRRLGGRKDEVERTGTVPSDASVLLREIQRRNPPPDVAWALVEVEKRSGDYLQWLESWSRT